jgi:hypothetical protein
VVRRLARGATRHRVREPERDAELLKFKLSLFDRPKLEIFKPNFETTKKESCRGDNHLQFLQRPTYGLGNGWSMNYC